MKYIPRWDRMACGADIYACYTLEKAMLLLLVDLEFQDKEAELEKSMANITDLKLIGHNLDLSLGFLKETKERLELRLEEKASLLEKNMHLTMKLAQRDIFGDAFPWVVLVFVVAAGSAFGAGYWLAN